jgi:hypothetical protein
MADIIKDDTNDQMIVCPITDTGYVLIESTVTPTSIYWSINNGSDVNLISAGATLTYDENLGGQKLVIPHAAITATGRYCLCIKSTDNANYNLDGLIKLPESSFATASSISALNNISQAQVLTQVGTGLTNYGAATATNVTNATSPLATAANLTTVDSVVDSIKTVTDALDVPTTTEIATAILGASIRTGRTVSQLLRIIEIILDGTITGLTSGSGSPVTITGADGSTVSFTIDENGNRAISSVNLS